MQQHPYKTIVLIVSSWPSFPFPNSRYVQGRRLKPARWVDTIISLGPMILIYAFSLLPTYTNHQTTVSNHPLQMEEIIVIGSSSGDESVPESTTTTTSCTSPVAKKRSRTRRRRGQRGGASPLQRPRSNSSGNLSDGESSSCASSTISSGSSWSSIGSHRSKNLKCGSKRSHPSKSKPNQQQAASFFERVLLLSSSHTDHRCAALCIWM